MLQAGPNYLLIFLRFNEPQAAQNTQRRFVQRNGMAVETILEDPGDRVIVSGLVASQLLGGLLQPLLVQRFQIKGESGFKDFLKQAEQPLRPNTGIWKIGNRGFNLPSRADADFVPVVKPLAKANKGSISPFSGCAFAAHGVEQLLQNRARLRLRGFVSFLEGVQ